MGEAVVIAMGRDETRVAPPDWDGSFIVDVPATLRGDRWHRFIVEAIPSGMNLHAVEWLGVDGGDVRFASVRFDGKEALSPGAILPLEVLAPPCCLLLRCKEEFSIDLRAGERALLGAVRLSFTGCDPLPRASFRGVKADA